MPCCRWIPVAYNFEVKHGGYQPVAADDYAHWAPAEGEPGTTELMAGMRKRRWATALLPSKAKKKRNEFPHSVSAITNRR